MQHIKQQLILYWIDFLLINDYLLTQNIAGYHIDWSAEPFVDGTYLASEPEQLTRYGPYLNKSHSDRIYFAAAERSSWPNSMEGAVESGEQTAAAILHSI